MELKLEVLLSSSIKGKRPWPRFSWLGKEKEAVFLLDDKRICEVSMRTGRLKKRNSKLQSLMPNVLAMASSSNGVWLAGLLASGDLFLWNKDTDLFKMSSPTPQFIQQLAAAKESGAQLSLQVSGDGRRVLLVSVGGQVLLWECTAPQELSTVRGASLRGHWSQVQAPAHLPFPSAADKEAFCHSLFVRGQQHNRRRVLLVSVGGQVLLWECTAPQELSTVRGASLRGHWSQVQAPAHLPFPSAADKEAFCHSLFVRGQAIGDACLTVFVFYAGEQLTLVFLKLQWEEGVERTLSAVGYSVLWVSRTYPVGQLPSPCSPVKSRGSLVASLSRDGLLLAVIINQKDPRVTQVMFVSTQNFVCVSAGLGGCGSKNLNIPAKYIRSYWVASACWSPDALFLACVLKRGSLLMLVRLGELVTLSTTGCDVDFAAAHFLPIHPLITYRPPVPVGGGDGNVSSSSVSVRDMFRQRYSVTWHPRTPLLILSDGYNATLLRVPSMPTPTALASRLLWDTAQGLEQARALMLQTQPQAHLESLSSLKFMSSLQALRDRVTPVPSLPLCFQDDGTLEDLQEAYEKAQADAEDECPADGQYSSGLRREERGSLELASMFDTLHAQPDLLGGGTIPSPSPSSQGRGPQQQQLPPLHSQLDGVQRLLLLAWTLLLSLGGRVEQRPRILKYAVLCASRLALLLQLGDGAVGKRKGKGRGKGKKGCWVPRVGNLYRTLLSFLPWDGCSVGGGGSAVSAAVELTGSFTQLILSASPDSPLSSHKLAAACGLLQTAGRTVDDAYAQRPRPRPLAQDGQLSDGYCTPMLQEQGGTTDSCPQRPSARLGMLWQGLYKQVLQYQAVLRSQCDPQSPPSQEEQELQATLCLVQAQLQRAGLSLAQDPALHATQGEELFLQGEYTQSTEWWRAELLAEEQRASATGSGPGPRSCYLQTRFGLALLYSHLQRYQLGEAQALADHMAHRLLQEPGQNIDAHAPEECVCGGWPAVRVYREAACAIVQSLGRFMAAYFANQPLAIRPAHCVDLLDPLHFPQAPGPRVVALSQQQVSAAVRSQQLSEQWTLGYALELLLIGGLLPEAVWLTSRLGDWTMAAALSLAYSSYCTDNTQLSSLRWKELHLPAELQASSIFQAQLQALLGPLETHLAPLETHLGPLETHLGPLETHLGPPAPGAAQETHSHRHLSEPVEEADEEQLCLCAQELLKASVMAKVDVLSHPIGQLLAVAKEMSSELMPLVPTGLYLPAPPLYCPQPSPTAQDDSVGVGLHAERACRLRVSAVLRKVLLLMRAARCALPAAQWYIRRLQRCHKNYRKIRKLSVLKEGLLPEGLKRFLSQSGFFKREAARHGRMDPIIVHILTCFRELCALLWMLHVRDQLTLACRKYQAARNQSRDAEMGWCVDPGLCEDAVRWACRLLPFSHFLCVEETLQDLLLSLLAQLPPTLMVAETLVKAFPEEEQSVRVALREKYTTLLSTLRSGPVVQPHDAQANINTDTQQEMASLLKKCRKQRAKFLARAAKHMTQVQHYLWERDEGGGGGEERSNILCPPDRLSLGGSLSSLTETTAATLTSNTDATTPQALSPDLQHGPLHSTLKPKAQNSSGPEAKSQKPTSSRQKPNSSRSSSSSRVPTPAVGSWEFELEDPEYLSFLELFLSYLLERAIGRGASDEPAELPLIGCFWARLRERELHSLGFDVLTTLKRRQRDVRRSTTATRPSGHHGDGIAPPPQLPVFQAGRSFLHHSQQTDTSPERPPSTTSSSYRPSLPTLPPWLSTSTSPSPGLWGSKQHHPSSRGGGVTLELSPSPSIVSRHKALLVPASPSLELQQELDPKLEARFPTLGRLLEWMTRWADRRVLLRRMEEQRGGAGRGRGGGGGGGGGGVMGPAIRAKASAPAVLTSLLLLERRYSAALLADDNTHMRVPAVELTVAPVLHPPTCSGERKERVEEKREEREKQEREKREERENEERERQRARERERERERESSVDTGYPGSIETPIALPDMDPQQPQALELCELLDVASESEGSVPGSGASGASGADSIEEEELRPRTQDGGDYRYSSDEDSFVEEELGSPAAQSPPPLSTGQSGQALTLADLVCADSPERPAAITHAEEERQSNGRTTPEASNTQDIQPIREAPAAAAAEQAERILPGPNPPSAPGAARGGSAPPGSAHPDQAIPSTNPAPAQNADTDTTNTSANGNPVTQLVQDELFRLVQLQQINFMSLMQVVGASFANLPLPQARLPIAQSTLLPQQPLPPPPAPSSTPVAPQPSPFTSQPNTAQSPLLSQPLQTPAPQPQVRAHQAQPGPTLLGPQLAAAPSPVSDSQTQPSRYSERPVLATHQPPQGHHQQAMQILTISPGRASHPDPIPASQGLLTTVAGASMPPTLPSSGSMQNIIPSLIPPEAIPTRPTGLRLLQLPPPQQPPLLRPPHLHPHHHHHQHPHHHHQHHHHHLPGQLVREAWGPQHHLPDSHPPPPTQQAPSAAHRHNAAAGGCAPPGLLPAPQHAAPPAPPVHGLPLLHLRPGPSLPLLPQPGVSAPAPAPAPGALLNPAGMGPFPFPRLQLLQRGPDPPGTGRSSAPPLRTPRLIPLEQLVSWAGGGGGPLASHAGGPPLLKASMPISSSSSTHDSHHSQPGCSTPSTHRQRRREEREKDTERTGKKPQVSFRPDDSIIPPEEEQPDAPEMEAPIAGDGFVLPLGSCDSMLTGQRLLAASYATSAELHAYASTQKRPPELQDAGTNTDTAPPLLTDKSTSAQASSPGHAAASQLERGEAEAGSACLPPELFLDLRFPREEGSTRHGDPSQGDKGRRFLNVIDLEDGALLQELSLLPVPTTTSTSTSIAATATAAAAAEPAVRSLTPAELHLLAATVNNNTHTQLTQQQPQELDELFAHARAQKPGDERPPLHTSVPPSISGLLPSTSTQQESSPPPPPSPPPPGPSVLEECRGDALTRSLLEKPLLGYARPGGSQDQEAGGSASASSSAQVTPVRQASARLSEMDRQLAALQKIADQMDREFADTHMLVRTIDNLSQEEQAHPAPVRVIKAVKSLAWGVPPGPSLALTDVVEEEEEEEESLSSRVAGAAAFGGVPPVRRRLTSHPMPTSSSGTAVLPRNASSTAVREQMMWDTSHDFTGTTADQSGSRLMEETLGLSGLSDVADILGDLVRDGGLSPTALGLSHAQAARLNRVSVGVPPPPPPLQQELPLRGPRSEPERRELRAWMRRKQRERLVEYRRQRDEWRAQERKPFVSHTQMKPNSRDVSINNRLKEEKNKMALLEHHAQRTSEAYSLMSDLLTSTLSPAPSVMTQPKSTSPPSARISIRSRSQSARPKSTSPASAKLSIRSRSQSAGRKSRSPGPAGSVASSGQQRLMGTTTLSRSSRLGLHRPATALPADRMSQVTRRGILTNTKARADTTLKENQRRPLSRSPPGPKTERSGQPREERGRTQRRDTQDTENSDNAENRELLSPWDPPLEIRRLLGLDTSHNGQRGGRGTEIGLDALETLSVSSGSIMSKLNWEEIEKMVAEVEEDDP